MTEPITEGIYEVSKEMYREGFEYYQKKLQGVKTVVFIIIFLAMGIYFAVLGAMHTDQKAAFVLSLVSFAMAFIAWYNPKKTKRMVMEVYDEIKGDKYLCQIYEDSIKISTIELGNGWSEDAAEEDIKKAAATGNLGIKPSTVPLNANTIVFEREKYFIAGNRQLFYIIPKSGFKEPEKLQEALKKFIK